MDDGTLRLLKKPKMEIDVEEEDEDTTSSKNGNKEMEEDEDDQIRKEQEEALIALIEHRSKEVQHIRTRISYYKSQLDEAEKRLEDAEFKLARVRGRNSVKTAKGSLLNGAKEVKLEKRSPSPVQIREGSLQNLNKTKPNPGHGGVKSSGSSERLDPGSASPFESSKYSSRSQPQSRPQLIIPAAEPKISQPFKTRESGSGVPMSSGSRPNISAPSHVNDVVKLKGDVSHGISPEKQVTESQDKGMKRKLELKEHKELIPLIGSSSSPSIIRCSTGSLISSQHKRKLRSLVLCPTNDKLFVTSALDGVVNLWQIQGRGSSANLLSTTDCVSLKQRRWPEDIAWHPQGNSLFSVYTADAGDTQISILNLNKTKERERVSFIGENPHVKGIINNIVFMPWEDTCFVTGGSDHAVVLWTEKDGQDSWKPKALHRSMHTSAVMGVAGLQQKKVILSVGADKRIIGFDLNSGKADYKHQIESKCMSVLPNPCDFNLFMVQTGTPGRQLRLFDIRLRHTELHEFGWKQESSESQSALINQAWSPDGLYITSGSADPVIHIFDIRYNARKPSQSIKAHQKRVFKAVWHYSFPLMITISSDLNVGLHKIT